MSISTYELSVIQARLARAGSPAANSSRFDGGVAIEATLHDDIIDYCRRAGWIYFHGRMDHKTFRSQGEPDFHILADHGRTFLIECKSKTGKPSLDQLSVICQAEHLGHKIPVIQSFAEFLAIVTSKPI